MRFAATDDATAAPATASAKFDSSNSGTQHTEVAFHDGKATGEGDADDAPFDEQEAALQEAHDLAHAMVQHLNNIHPIRSWRGHEPYKHPGHHHIVERKSAGSTYSKAEMKRGCEMFDEMGAKLLPLLSSETIQKMINSASTKSKQLYRNSGRHSTTSQRATNIVNRNGVWRGNVLPKMFRHSPFEVEQLRSDISEKVVAATRGERDLQTLKNLFILMDNPSPVRATLEDRCWATISKLNSNLPRD